MQIEYILKKSHRKSISIKINDDRKILIKAPYGTTVAEAENFLREKRDWINKQLSKLDDQTKLAKELGLLTPDDIRKLKAEAKRIIPERVKYYAEISGIKYKKIFIRLQKTRWGSCSVDGNLNFNCLLALMPLEILDSVVVHELCHRRHMNHSRAFYAEVLKLFPEYKKCDKWLKQNGGAYFKRLPENY